MEKCEFSEWLVSGCWQPLEELCCNEECCAGPKTSLQLFWLLAGCYGRYFDTDLSENTCKLITNTTTNHQPGGH